jgi:hemolysin activation/secretion protein
MSRRALAFVLGFSAAAAFGQASVPLDQLPRPSEQPLPQAPPLAPRPEIVLPPLPRPDGPALSRGLTIAPKAFRFVGNTAVPTEELERIAAPYVGRPIGNAELEALRQLVTRRYIEAGYVNSGAVIPDQDVADGVITLQVVEGRVSQIVVGGAQGFRPSVLANRLALGAGPPLNVNDLQERMQLMLQDPLISQLSAQLAPGIAPGEAVLRVDVAEAKRYLVGIALDDDRSPAVGAYQAQPFFVARNVLGLGDVLGVRGAFTSGVDEGTLTYGVPLTARGLALNARYVNTRSRIVEAPLDELDISAKSQAFDVGLAYPVWQALQGEVATTATLSRRSTRSYFLGEPSTFIPGAPDGKVVNSAIRLGIEGTWRTQAQVLAGRLLVSRGFDGPGSTIAPEEFPDSVFTTVIVQLQWVRLLGANAQFVARGDMQRAFDPLVGSEKYSLGGLDSVRGYRKDALVRDSGRFVSAELRYLIGRYPLIKGPAGGEGALRLAAFFDYGQVWDYAASGEKRPLSSAGPGIRWEPVRGSELALYYGRQLRTLDTPTETLPDRGFNVRLTLSYAF